MRFSLTGGGRGPVWNVRQACEGTQIFGATGTGKTSASGRCLALSLLRARVPYPPLPAPVRFGGLVLTAKPDELSTWIGNEPEHEAGRIGYCPFSDREADVVVFGNDLPRYRDWGYTLPVDSNGEIRPFQFNFLEYERRANADADLIQNLVAIFLTALGSARERGPGVDPYWEDALRQLLTNAIDLVVLAKPRLSLQDITQVILTAPQSREQVRSPTWRAQSECWRCLELANGRKDLKPGRREDLKHTVHYWLLDFAGLAERTRSVVVSSFTSKATALLRSPLRELLAAGDTDDDVTPEASMRGKIIILDLSVKQYGEVGRFAQVLYKTVWQRAVERRRFGEATPGPVFLWADESQYFVTKEDMFFQQTARSSLAATIYLTQNLPNYYAAMESRDAVAATDSLLGNFQAKLFHANGDPVTNDWAERLFGRLLRSRTGFQNTRGEPDAHGRPDYSFGTSSHQAWEPRIPAIEFTQLKKGGPPELVAEALLWLNGEPLRVAFPQRGVPEAP